MLPGSNLLDIRRIYSHPQALGQCINFIEKLREKTKNLDEISTSSTSEAAEIVVERKDIHSAAIGSELSATINNLQLVKRNIADIADNQTRFLVIGRNKTVPTGNDKTFIVFSVNDKPGGLVRVLEVFDVLGINQNIKIALQRIKERSEWVKVLGSYPINKR